MKKLLAIAMVAGVMITACKKHDDVEAPRLFRPVSAGVLSADSNTIEVGWQKIGGAVQYELQLSKDAFATVDVTVATDTSYAVVTKLLFSQLYQLRVRAIAADTARNSKWAKLGEIKTLSSILKTPGLEDITTNSVRIRWSTKGAPVTAVKILKAADSTVVKEVTLTATDVTNEYVVATGLEAGTPYIIVLYSGSDARGSANFSSKAPFAGTIIDLSGITGKPSVLLDTLPKVTSGSVILLRRGETYNMNAGYAIDKSLIIMSAPDLENTTQAHLYFTSNLSFAAAAAIDSVEFNDVHMYSDNYASRYIFNNTNSANVGKLKFVNSRMEIFRGMVRLQSGTLNMGTFVIDNCIVDSIGNYQVLNIAATCKIDNIAITNSTIYKVEGVVASASAANTVLVDACTFNEAPLGNSKNYYFDYNTNMIANGITVTNCLFGIGKNSAGALTVRDVRMGSGTVISLANNYRTSDHTSAGNDFPVITTYTRPSNQLWVAPLAGDFKIADNAFPAKNTAGDPRWR
ncbi:protein of unknown function [Filimonas lacunae]|uniref:Fibronectin type-III domain-containing protein n=1 Tax=Filimonas lacunae TaxID=477680 RepID=A0A173MJ04_9BACT|nr:DUF5123 domain-containing protein [Filimonas lacunae]BAV07456.1 hypothetical protein FLA_3481 [Filimonas lacunae]SIT30307.1 protein of unknown function [Filimonas lacunae]